MVLVSVLAAFCAAVNTDEKKPPEPPGDPCVPGVRVPGTLLSSMVGVNGAETALESLLGGRPPVSDLTRRWDIILPEGDVMVLEFVPAEACFRTGEFIGLSLRWSVGVGGVTVVKGVSRPALVGVFGAVFIGGRSLAPVVMLRALALFWDGFETAWDSLRLLPLFCLSAANILPKVFALPFEIIEARSGLPGGLSVLFLDLDLKTSLIREPGETPRPSLVESASFVSREVPV